MNYSKRINRKAIARRNISLWVVIAIIFFIIGITVSATFGRESKKEILVYGQADGKIFNGEIKNYESDLQFIPLNVDMDEELQEFTFYLSTAYDIDFSFVMALIKQESNFNVDALNGGNYGLMQINEVNFDTITDNLGITEFTEPHNNIKSGMFILRKLFEKYEEPQKVLMAYNMGETGASRLWEQGVYESNYSRCIMLQAKEYTNEINGKRGNSND